MPKEQRKKEAKKKNSTLSMETLLPLAQAAHILGVSEATLRNWDSKKKIRTVRTPGNHRRIPREEVERLLRGEK